VMSAIAERAPVGVKARGFVLLRLASNLGLGVGPAIGGMLALYSYSWLFVVDAVSCWLAALLLLLLLRPPAKEEPTAAGSATSATRSPWRDWPFLGLMLLVVAMATVLFQVFATLPLYFRQVYGYRENSIGLLLACNAALIVIFEMVLMLWAEKRDRALVLGAGVFLLCAGLSLMPFGSSVLFVAATIAVWTVGEMLALPLINVVVAERAASSQRGRYMGLYMMAFATAFIIAPVSGTWAFDSLGPDALWYGIGLLGFPMTAATVLLVRYLDREKRAAQAVPE